MRRGSSVTRALGGAIRATRVEQGLTQEAFAIRAGIDRSYLGAVERGEFNVTVDTLARIADGLGVPAWELLRGGKREAITTADAPGVKRPVILGAGVLARIEAVRANVPAAKWVTVACQQRLQRVEHDGS